MPSCTTPSCTSLLLLDLSNQCIAIQADHHYQQPEPQRFTCALARLGSVAGGALAWKSVERRNIVLSPNSLENKSITYLFSTHSTMSTHVSNTVAVSFLVFQAMWHMYTEKNRIHHSLAFKQATNILPLCLCRLIHTVNTCEYCFLPYTDQTKPLSLK